MTCSLSGVGTVTKRSGIYEPPPTTEYTTATVHRYEHCLLKGTEISQTTTVKLELAGGEVAVIVWGKSK